MRSSRKVTKRAVNATLSFELDEQELRLLKDIIGPSGPNATMAYIVAANVPNSRTQTTKTLQDFFDAFLYQVYLQATDALNE